MISYDEALKHIGSLPQFFFEEELKTELTLGRILSRSVDSQLDSPLFDNSAMDGFGISSSMFQSHKKFRVIGKINAGEVFADSINEADFLNEAVCARIMTGAPIPDGIDCIIPVEWTESEILSSDNSEWMSIKREEPFQPFIRKRGSDFPEGKTILAAGEQVTPEKLMLLIQAGVSNLWVYKAPKILVIATGDELISSSRASSSSIVNSSTPYLTAALEHYYKIKPKICEVISDDPKTLEAILRPHLQDDESVLILTTGAVSMGDKDFIPQVAVSLNFKPLFHRVAIRPGKPVFLALRHTKNRSAIWLGLPGNPVSTAVGFQFFIRPLMSHIAKYPFPKRWKVCIIGDVSKPKGLTCFFRGRVFPEQGKAEVHPQQGSAQLLAYATANAYIILSTPNPIVESGSVVDVQTI